MKITRARLLAPLAAIAMLTATSLPAWAESKDATAKGVFQVSDNDPAKWNLTLNNVKNVQQDLGAEKVELEVVVYGPGISMLKKESPVGARVAAALKAGVKVVACENTMRNQKLKYGDMLPDIGYVPAGVVELMAKQREGFAYIKP